MIAVLEHFPQQRLGGARCRAIARQTFDSVLAMPFVLALQIFKQCGNCEFGPGSDPSEGSGGFLGCNTIGVFQRASESRNGGGCAGMELTDRLGALPCKHHFGVCHCVCEGL